MENRLLFPYFLLHNFVATYIHTSIQPTNHYSNVGYVSSFRQCGNVECGYVCTKQKMYVHMLENMIQNILNNISIYLILEKKFLFRYIKDAIFTYCSTYCNIIIYKQYYYV